MFQAAAHRLTLCFAFSLLWAGTALADISWSSDVFNAKLRQGSLQLFHEGNRFAQIDGFAFNFIPATLERIEKGSDSGFVLVLALTSGDGFHANFPQQVEVKVTLEDKRLRFHAAHESFNHITIQLKDHNEHYFGLIEKLYPRNEKRLDLRGETVDVEVYALGEKDHSENYASAYSAFYMSSAGYGSFFDTFAKGQYKFAQNGITEIYHQTDTLDWYLMVGKDGAAIHQQYFRLIGEPKAVPMWAMGPIFWRDYNEGKDEILADIAKFTELRIPLTATFVDRPYSHGGHEWSKMDFTEKFANPKEWIGTINNHYGMEFMSWVGPMTFGDTEFPGLLPNHMTYIDLTDPEAIAEFKRRLDTHQYSVGVKGHKMDRADENFPVTALWHQPVTESESRNKYVYLYAKVIHEFLQDAHGPDNFNFARATFHRAQPYLSAIWGGDNRPNWMGMSGNQTNAMRAGFLGFPIWGNDTGGYLGDGRIDEKLYTRWLQWSAWNGMFEVKIDGMGGSGEDRAPWRYSEQLQSVFRQVAEQRMALAPYAYSLANTSTENGVLMKPLPYVFLQDEKTYDLWDQYLFGDAFLVAPLFSASDKRAVYLPEGQWHEYGDPTQVHKGPMRFEQEYGITATPVFIRANSIYVTGDVYRGNSRRWLGDLQGQESLTIHVFPHAKKTATRFTYVDYLDGNTHKLMKAEGDRKHLRFESPALTVAATAQIQLAKAPKEVQLNGEHLEVDYDKAAGQLKVTLPPDTLNVIEIRR